MRLALRKIILVLFVSLIVASCCFLATHLLPGDIALKIAAVRYSGIQPSQELADVVRQLYGLDRPILVQYFDWLIQTLQFDFGRSLVTGRDVTHGTYQHAINSFHIVCWGFLAGISIAFPIGYICAQYQNSKIDIIITTFSATISTIPSFLVAIFMVQYFVVDFNLATLSGTTGWSRIWIIVMTIALAVSGPLSRVIRASVIEVNNSPYMMYATMRGVPKRQLFLRHGLKNTLRPILNYLPVVFMFLIYDCIVIEIVFNFQGLGWALINAVKANDIPVIQALVLWLVIFYLVTTSLCEMLTLTIYRQKAYTND